MWCLYTGAGGLPTLLIKQYIHLISVPYADKTLLQLKTSFLCPTDHMLILNKQACHNHHSGLEGNNFAETLGGFEEPHC